MTRLLLTLLAVLTGLVAQVSPATARVGGATRAEVAVQMPDSGTVVAAARTLAGWPQNLGHWRMALSHSPVVQRTSVYPPVMIGIDRTRE